MEWVLNENCFFLVDSFVRGKDGEGVKAMDGKKEEEEEEEDDEEEEDEEEEDEE